jgi:hypothetical protein
MHNSPPQSCTNWSRLYISNIIIHCVSKATLSTSKQTNKFKMLRSKNTFYLSKFNNHTVIIIMSTCSLDTTPTKPLLSPFHYAVVLLLQTWKICSLWSRSSHWQPVSWDYIRNHTWNGTLDPRRPNSASTIKKINLRS